MQTTHGAANENLLGFRFSSFWSENLEEGPSRDVRESLMSIQRHSGVYRIFQNGVRRMVGLGDRYETNILVPIRDRDVVQIGPDLQKRLVAQAAMPDGTLIRVIRRPMEYSPKDTRVAPLNNEDAEFILNEGYEIIMTHVHRRDEVTMDLDPLSLYPRYVIPIPEDIKPIMILGGREMVVGLDFTLGDGCIVVSAPPDTLFPDKQFLIKSAESQNEAPLSFTCQVDNIYEGNEKTSHYLRGAQTLKSFRQALYEVGNIKCLPADGTLQDIKKSGKITWYVFEDFVLKVPYNHTSLAIGQFYEKDHALSDGLQAFGPGSTRWWRQVDWSQGFALDQISPFSGLSFPDQLVGTNFNQSQYFPINGPDETVSQFWNYIAECEGITGIQLQSVAGSSINPIDFMFENVLSDRAIIVRVDPDVLGEKNARNVIKFARREHPVGSVLIITQNQLALT